MLVTQILALAQKHVGSGAMASSARLCFDDAMTRFARADLYGARCRALRSLAYSVGILHPDYRAAMAK